MKRCTCPPEKCFGKVSRKQDEECGAILDREASKTAQTVDNPVDNPQSFPR